MITGGQSLVSSAPAFSNDSKKLLVCTGNSVSIFSTSTGMLITELEGHTDRVTSVIVVPASGPVSKFMSYCWTSSLDGNICYWDFSAAELIKKINTQQPIISMVKEGMEAFFFYFVALQACFTLGYMVASVPIMEGKQAQ
ncbi:WD repeat-containing protein 75-like [Phalaenopsis equestris]|uniref:WD repeat-containing protein 75-like n=1 Tax=Phalaenopsis equestris TaxID=78828 RepID=UPI0009E2AE38|nr:WD repeat-containing protein 75-like [Phalaenopsis equestris]